MIPLPSEVSVLVQLWWISHSTFDTMKGTSAWNHLNQGRARRSKPDDHGPEHDQILQKDQDWYTASVSSKRMDENSCCHLMSNHPHRLTSTCHLIQTTNLKAYSQTLCRSSCSLKRQQDTEPNEHWTPDVHEVLCATEHMAEQRVFCSQEQALVGVKQRSDALTSTNTGRTPKCNQKWRI